ncbi:MAG: hypothetical protein JKY32_03755 [Rhizobiales bacterium]|nr:hypothetical protein [Hyphomicrobiales bacterium]
MLLGILPGASPGLAVDTWYPAYESHQRYYKSDNGLRANEILDEDGFRDYQSSIAVDDCDPAYALLANAYAKTYPEEPHPGFDIISGANWDVFVTFDNFPELAFCLEMRQLREARAAIVREEIEFERYFEDLYFGDQTYPRPVTNLADAFHGLSLLAGRRYLPAYLALLRLSDEGEIIRYTKEFQYYLALRTRDLGLNTEEVADITARAAARLDAETIAELTREAEDGHFTYSKEWLE